MDAEERGFKAKKEEKNPRQSALIRGKEVRVVE
jgi:hypothetical protein